MLKILKAYGIPEIIVDAIQGSYSETRAKVTPPDGETDEFEIFAGVLQGDTLAPYLFIITLDYCLRLAIDGRGEDLGFTVRTRRSRRIGPFNITDLDFADDIALLSNTASQAQELLDKVEHAALRVGIACNSLNNIWRSNLTKSIKLKFFQATVESVLLYGSETWTVTNKIGKSLDGCYTRMLRRALDVSWKDHITNKELYGDLPKITTQISKRRLQFAGHCKRSEGKIVSELVTWRPTQGRRSAGRPTKTFVDLLHQDTGFTTHEIEACMQDRRLWKAIIGVRQKMPE